MDLLIIIYILLLYDWQYFMQLIVCTRTILPKLFFISTYRVVGGRFGVSVLLYFGGVERLASRIGLWY